MQAVYSSSLGYHIPFDNVLYVNTDKNGIWITLIDGVTSFQLTEGADEFMKQWYAWLHKDVEEVTLEIQPHPSAKWGQEEMQQFKDENRDKFDAGAELRKRVRQIQGGIDVL